MNNNKNNKNKNKSIPLEVTTSNTPFRVITQMSEVSILLLNNFKQNVSL